MTDQPAPDPRTSLQPEPPADGAAQQPPILRPDIPDVVERMKASRRGKRIAASFMLIVFGMLFLALGQAGVHVRGDSHGYILGGGLLAGGVLGLLGVNVFRGGPLDKRDDPE